MIRIIFTTDGSGTHRSGGYVTVPYTSNSENETLVETTEDDLSAIFDQAKSSGETLDGTDASIDAAVDDPLAFRDFLILDSNDTIVFDSDYERQTPTSG